MLFSFQTFALQITVNQEVSHGFGEAFEAWGEGRGRAEDPSSVLPHPLLTGLFHPYPHVPSRKLHRRHRGLLSLVTVTVPHRGQSQGQAGTQSQVCFRLFLSTVPSNLLIQPSF